MDDDQPGIDGSHARTVLSRDLPDLLVEFERKRGITLIEDQSKSQLEGFCEQFPDHRIDCDDLVNMITNLESAREPSEHDDMDDVESGSSHSHSQQSSASTDSRPMSPSELGVRSSTPPPAAHPFPRSQSHSVDATIGPCDVAHTPDLSPSRTRTSSASVAGDRSRDGSSGTRRESQIDTPAKDVLRGKGRAPPSSWQRPRPQALASSSRVRKTSDVSSSHSDGRLSSTSRPRKTSQPLEVPHTLEPGPVRSTSSGYVFPRATSPFYGDDSEWYADQHDRWNAERTRSVSSRAGSPEANSPAFQPFSSLGSPSIRQGMRLGPDGGDGGVGDGDDSQALERRYDALARTLQDKERHFEFTQNAHEATIADLESRVEHLQERIHGLTRSGDEMRQKEQRYLDEISRLEGDLAASQRRSDTAERVKDVMQQDLAYRETSIANLQGKINDLQERIAAAERDEAEHFDVQRAWDQDREQYRQQIEQLRGQVHDAGEKEAKLEQLESEKEALRVQLRDLHTELEEARRGSGFVTIDRGGQQSQPSTMSKKGGSSLGSELRGTWTQPQTGGDSPSTSQGGQRSQDNEEGIGSSDEEMDAGEGPNDIDASLESIVVTRTRRRRSRQNAVRTFQEVTTQTDAAEAGPSANVEADGDLPSYNEAALEKTIVERLHPNLVPGEHLSGDDEYAALVRALGMRCTTMEAMAQRRQQRIGSTAGSPNTSWLATTVELLPRPVKSLLHHQMRSGRRTSSRLLVQAVVVLLIGALLGHLLSSSSPAATTHHHHHYQIGATLEDGLAWHISNSLNLGLGASHVEYAPDPLDRKSPRAESAVPL